MGAPALSIAVIARDEAKNLRRLLPAIAPLGAEIVLVDSGSTDGTIEVAAAFGARVLRQSWLGFGPQKNFAIEQCTGEWVLSLDADEVPSPELLARLPKALAEARPELAGYYVARKNHFLGRPIRHGGYYPDRKLRLFRRGRARFEARAVHESMIANGPTAVLDGDLLHEAYPSLALYLEHMNRYSSVSVPLALEHGRSSRSLVTFLWNILANPLATFAYNYGLRGGFLDGREGFLLHLYHSCYVSWKYAKAWEQARAAQSSGRNSG